MEKTIKFLKENIDKNHHIILGCSGGPDSMCLLNILKQNNYKIVCIHINHNIRVESSQEQEFLKNYCSQNNITFHTVDLKPENQNEAYYRKIRYDIYKKYANQYKTKYIMTAHHGDDLIETILMRQSRGSNLNGYAGFTTKKEKDQYIFLKPLIYYTKDEIISYNQKKQIPFVIDSSNMTDKYTRNRYRHNILPYLKIENKNVHKKYLEFSETLIEAEKYIDSQVEDAIKDNYQDNKIDLNKFLKLDIYIQKRELEKILNQIYDNNVELLNKKHLTSIINCLKKSNNFKINLPHNYIIERNYNELSINISHNQEKHLPYYHILKNKIVLDNGNIIEYTDAGDDTSNNTIRLNSKDIVLPLIVRTRNIGDKIEVKNLNGSKSIKSIFIDEKINRAERDTYPIVTDSNNTIIWIPGLRKSKFDNEKNKKYDIILRYTQKGKD